MQSARRASRVGQRTVLWSPGAHDWGPFARAWRIESRLSRTRTGDSVLMHVGRNRRNHPWETLRALPVLIGSLQEAKLPAMPIPARTVIGSVSQP